MVRVRDATQDETDWVKHDHDAQKELGQHFIDKAGEYQTIWTAVYGIYTTLLIAFGLMNGTVLTMLILPGGLIFLLPILGWLVGIYYFFRVLQPEIGKLPPNSPSAIQGAVYAANVQKAINYRNGLWAFGIGVLLMVPALGAGSYFASLTPAQATGNVQLVVTDDAPPFLSQIPIELVPGTNRTVVVSLVKTTDSGYSIRLANGDIADLPKDWVRLVIRKGG